MSLLLAPRRAATISLSLSWTASESLFWERWIRNTIRNVTIVVPVFITSCHVSENAKMGPVTSQPAIKSTASPNAQELPVHSTTTPDARSSDRPSADPDFRRRMIPCLSGLPCRGPFIGASSLSLFHRPERTGAHRRSPGERRGPGAAPPHPSALRIRGKNRAARRSAPAQDRRGRATLDRRRRLQRWPSPGRRVHPPPRLPRPRA